MADAMDFNITADLQGGNDAAPLDSAPVSAPVETKPVEAPAEAKPDKAASLRDQISSSLKGETVTPSAAQQDGQPARNPDGTFAPKAGEAPVADPAAAVAAAANPAAAPVAATVPQGLNPALAPTFNALPAEWQHFVAGTMEALNKQAPFQQLDQVIAPERVNAWALNGMTPAAAVHQLLALSDFAGKDPAGFIKYFAQQQRINLEDLAFGPDPVDPNIAALQQQLGNVTNQLTQQQQFAQQQQYNALIGEITNVLSSKDANGADQFAHVDELGDTLLPFIQIARQSNPNAGVGEVVKSAYEQACWAHPTVRQKMQANIATQQSAEQLAQRTAEARKAVKAGSSVPQGSPQSAATPEASMAGKSIRDTIKASIAQAS